MRRKGKGDSVKEIAAYWKDASIEEIHEHIVAWKSAHKGGFMEVNEIRKLVSRRPFRSIIFHLENGSSRLISHPEIIITESIVVAVDEEGEAVYIAPEAITSITYQKASKTAKRVRPAASRKR